MENQIIEPEGLEEKKERIFKLFENQKAKDDLEDYATELLVEYIECIVGPYSLSEEGKMNVHNLIREFTLEEIFSAIDKGKKQYLEYDSEGILTKDSALKFVNKIGGIIVTTRKGPITSKLNYLMGICKNRFLYWDHEKGSAILNRYITALRKQNYSDEDILEDLDTDVIELCKTSQNWSQWRNQINSWIEEINSWDKQEDDEIDADEIIMLSQSLASKALMFFDFIWYLSKAYGEYDQRALLKYFLTNIDKYLTEQISVITEKNGASKEDFVKLKPNRLLSRNIVGFIIGEPIDSGVKFCIDEMVSDYVPVWLEKLFLPSNGIYTTKNALLFKSLFDESMNENLKDYDIVNE